MAIGDRLKFVTNADGQVVPIRMGTGTSEVGKTTASMAGAVPTKAPPGTGLTKYNPFQINNLLKTAGRLAPYAGPAGGLLSAGIIANTLLSDDGPSVEEDILTAEKGSAWVRRALNPLTETTDKNETIRSATDKHSVTGEYIVYPTIRSIGGKLVTLDRKAAKKQSESLNDFISFESLAEAERFSRGLSDEISNRRRMSNQQGRGLL